MLKIHLSLFSSFAISIYLIFGICGRLLMRLSQLLEDSRQYVFYDVFEAARDMTVLCGTFYSFLSYILSAAGFCFGYLTILQTNRLWLLLFDGLNVFPASASFCTITPSSFCLIEISLRYIVHGRFSNSVVDLSFASIGAI